MSKDYGLYLRTQNVKKTEINPQKMFKSGSKVFFSKKKVIHTLLFALLNERTNVMNTQHRAYISNNQSY